MVDLTDHIDKGDIEEAKFLSKKVSEMDRDELLAVLNWLADENERLENERYELEKDKANLMGSI